MMAAVKTSYCGDLRINEPMSKHTSWAVGGIAQRFYRPIDITDLQLFLSEECQNHPVHFIGLGSNLLVRDGGVKGTVISLKGVMNDFTITDNKVSVMAGVTCAKLASAAAKQGLSGATFLVGIPGTLGGALAMNAGAHGAEIWDYVERVTMLSPNGEMLDLAKSEFDIAYRHASFKGKPDLANHCFVAAELSFESGDKAALQNELKAFLTQRAEKQPVNQRSCGSVFTNPEGDFAARLIQECGLKGYQIGGAQVSEKHANFIVNTGTASAADIESLIQYLQETVAEKQGVQLSTEVRMIGEAA